MRWSHLLILLFAASSARAGIIRQDVRHFSKSGSSGLIGDVTLSEGSGIILTQIGQNITITASSSGGSTLSRATKTANYTLANTDDVVFGNTQNGVFTITVQTSSSATAKVFYIKNIGVNDLTINTSGGDNIEGLSSQTLSPDTILRLFPDGGTTWYAF